MKLFNRFLNSTSPYDVTLAGAILPPSRMQVVLQRERMRADRTFCGFSLIVFSANGLDRAAGGLRRLSRIATQRMRCTDEIGWLDRYSLGLVLLECSSADARTIADDLLGRTPARQTGLSYRVESYPSDDLVERPQSQRGPTVPQETLPPQTPAVFMRPLPLWKRGLDLFGAIIGLSLLLPLFAIVAAIIRSSSPGPVFFSQLRTGWGGKPFRLYKFRSMVIDAESRQTELRHANEQDGPAFKLSDDPRVTKFGNFLRKTSIDELPQLWNVFKGEMTLVGPRPLPCAEQQAALPWQQRRLDVMPGLTCIWQIQGRSKVSFAQWVRMDLEYIRKFSLWTDTKILLATIPAVLLRRGAK